MCDNDNENEKEIENESVADVSAVKDEPEAAPEESEFVTMLDVLEEEQKLEEDAAAVLGASDEKNCTYGKGYVERQALYACMTCCPGARDDPTQRAGVCLACSYHCHEGHELVELYTKRHFRCDCGNDKFTGSSKCNLEPHKEPTNALNSYNHNFSGVYCTCERPYPDPEDSVPDDMIQCVVCEDWFHCRHLGAQAAAAQATPYAEMTCGQCVQRHSFLLDYTQDVVEVSGECVRPARQDDAVTAPAGDALFWPDGWRMRLCSCDTCLAMYAEHGVQYLRDTADTVHAYEQRGRCVAPTTTYEQGLRALSAMERTAQLEAIQHYNDMKDELKEYLQTFAEAGRIVREQDIRDFFSRMNAKRPRLDMPYSCR